MKKDGVGGANTKTGLAFELETDLPSFISKQPGYEVTENDFDIKILKRTGEIKKKPRKSVSRWEVSFQGNVVAEIFQKHGLYRYFNEVELDYQSIISRKLLPDDAIFVISNNTVFIIEKKTQKGQGSVDEKLQTCDFKLKQYRKLFAPLNKEVRYYYLLDKSWFDNPAYKDVLDYIIDVGCGYYFNYIPLEVLGLPIPLEES
ncbi:PD-(D/E)XK nuclease superfamily protein [Streptococcus sp. E29BA]|uniref:PD-(D/E)XK nuclease superfamily protein n=1 Tax=Streptococcus sp. E29BA TaxID=3278716 RepID=UPI00359D59E0